MAFNWGKFHEKWLRYLFLRMKIINKRLRPYPHWANALINWVNKWDERLNIIRSVSEAPETHNTKTIWFDTKYIYIYIYIVITNMV